VTQLGIAMAEREMTLSDNLFAKLYTSVMHNTGRAASRVTEFMADVPLRQWAESRGYIVTWNAADSSVTMVKDGVSYTVTPESYDCVTASGEVVELSHYCYVKDGLTYIPMDFAETL